jgi:nickel/cobalt transporter (NicO) family protein
MESEIGVLSLSAATIAFAHTLMGPDHYLPLVAMAKSRRWSISRLLVLTLLCGLGHIGASVILGAVGIVLGIASSSLEVIQSWRGEWAAWALISLGLIYLAWGIHKACRDRQHVDGSVDGLRMSPLILLMIFIVGPCESMIPLLMYPAAKDSFWGVFIVAGVFSLVTLVTMTSAVLLSSYGISWLKLSNYDRFTHAISGGAVTLCGCSIIMLGL